MGQGEAERCQGRWRDEVFFIQGGETKGKGKEGQSRGRWRVEAVFN